MSQANVSGSSWQGPFSDLAKVLQHIQHVQGFGRLSLRNAERAGLVHFYFRAGKLVHVVGHRSDAYTIIFDLQTWRQATLRFDRGVTVAEVSINEQHEQLFKHILSILIQRRVVARPPGQSSAQPSSSSPPQPQPRHISSSVVVPRTRLSQMPRPVQVSPLSTTPIRQVSPTLRVVDGNVIAVSEVQELIAPDEWRVLVEGTRRVSLAVAHLVGPREALQVLRDILDDCSASFPAFTCLTVAPTGYLQITDQAQINRLARNELLEGFAALIAICQYFCSPLIGERKAHQLVKQALRELVAPLEHLGVFRIEASLLTQGEAPKT